MQVSRSQFGTHFRTPASICKFLVEYPSSDTKINYTENILHNVLTCGVVDSEIQLDLLGDKNQDMTPQEEFQFVGVKEAGKLSELLKTQGADVAHSHCLEC